MIRLRSARQSRRHLKPHRVRTGDGSAAFLNEAINQLAEAYLFHSSRRKVAVFRRIVTPRSYSGENVHCRQQRFRRGLKPGGGGLAEVSLWLNAISGDAFVPWLVTSCTAVTRWWARAVRCSTERTDLQKSQRSELA